MLWLKEKAESKLSPFRTSMTGNFSFIWYHFATICEVDYFTDLVPSSNG